MNTVVDRERARATVQVAQLLDGIRALADKWQGEMDSFDTSKPDARVDAAVTRIHITELRRLLGIA